MVDVIIIIIITMAVFIGLSETIKHFKGEGTCCGGGSTKPKKKKLKGKVICTYTFHIDGMHQTMARSLLQLPAGISFGESNDDIFLKPYFDLMKELETIEKQYKQQTQK